VRTCRYNKKTRLWPPLPLHLLLVRCLYSSAFLALAPALPLSARGLRPFFLNWRFLVSSISLASSSSSNVGPSPPSAAAASSSSLMGSVS